MTRKDNSSNDDSTRGTEHETVSGNVVDTRELPERDGDFKRAVENKLEFRNLEGGTYKLVRVDDRFYTVTDANQGDEEHDKNR